MATVYRNSWVLVPTRRGGKTTAATTADVEVHVGPKRRRTALGPLGLYKADHPDGGKVRWTLPAGTEFELISGPERK